MQNALTHAIGLAGALAVWACPAGWLWLGLIGPIAALACLGFGIAALVAAAAGRAHPETEAAVLAYAFSGGKPDQRKRTSS